VSEVALTTARGGFTAAKVSHLFENQTHGALSPAKFKALASAYLGGVSTSVRAD